MPQLLGVQALGLVSLIRVALTRRCPRPRLPQVQGLVEHRRHPYRVDRLLVLAAERAQERQQEVPLELQVWVVEAAQLEQKRR